MCIRDRLSTVDSCSASPSAHRQLGLPQRRRWVTTEPRTSRGSPADSGSAITHTSNLTVVHCQIMAHNDAVFLDLQGVSRQQSVPGRATCPRDRSHQDAPSDVTPEEPHPNHMNRKAFGHFLVDRAQELQKLLVAVFVHARPNDGAIDCVQGAVVLCMDEKTSIQALDHTQ